MVAGGLFPHISLQKELEILRRGDFRQMKVIHLNMADGVGFPKNLGSRGLVEDEGNGLILLPRLRLEDGTIPNSVNGQIYVKINHPENPWIPMSFNANSTDFSSITAAIFRFWVFLNQNAAGFMYLCLLKGCALGSSGAAGGASGGDTAFTASKP
jgi:hypothetical protein